MRSSQATLRVSQDLAQLPLLVAFIESFAEQHKLHSADAFVLTVATEELFTNTLRHSQPPATWSQLSLELNDKNVTAIYCDDGAPFDPTHQHAPDITLPAAERALGGLGIEIIRKTMQAFGYERVAEINHVTFVRARHG
jgi:anti-sigma regulatory factor (Ser/Thr protein kinase)